MSCGGSSLQTGKRRRTGARRSRFSTLESHFRHQHLPTTSLLPHADPTQMPATTADHEVWLPAGDAGWSFDVLGDDDIDEMNDGDFPDPDSGWNDGLPWTVMQSRSRSEEERLEREFERIGNVTSLPEDQPKEEEEDNVRIIGDDEDHFAHETRSLPSSPGLFFHSLTSSPELDYEMSQSSNQRGQDNRRGTIQQESSPQPNARVSFAPFGAHPTNWDGLTERPRLPPLGDIVDLTSSSPSQLMTSLAPRSYNSHSARETNNHGPNGSGSGNNSSNNNTMAIIPNPTQYRPSTPKRRRTGNITVLSQSTQLSPILPSIRNTPNNDANEPTRPRSPTSIRRQTQTRNLPPISSLLRMPPGASDNTEIESIDLIDVDDSSSLSRVLAQQREQAIQAQNAAAKKPEEEDFSKSIMTHYKCPVCMDVLTNATATVCGMHYSVYSILNTSLHPLPNPSI
jgi:hypothetical protein